MISPVQRPASCTNIDPDQLLFHLNHDHTDSDGAMPSQHNFMVVIHLRAVANREGWLSLPIDELKEEPIFFPNNLDFIFDI